MEFQQLRGFFYSVKLGNLTKAAEKMSVTQSAVSQQIKSLEDELGVKLFNRFGPRKDLTSDGKLFFNLISPVIQEIDALKVTFEDLKGNQRGQLTIAATTFMIMNQLPNIIKKFTKIYPHVKLSILERRWNEIVSLAQLGEIDFGLAPISKVPPNLKFIKLDPIERVLITCLKHPLSKKKNVTLLDIAQYPMITYEKGLVSRDKIDHVFEDLHLDVEIVMEATNSETIKKYVEMGIGIAVIPKIVLFPSQNRKLETISVNKHFGKSQYGIILRKGKHITTWAKNFLLMLAPALKDQLEETATSNESVENS
ncbi:MAG: LysR substrate-binding domain-containing protein [bacterium]